MARSAHASPATHRREAATQDAVRWLDEYSAGVPLAAVLCDRHPPDQVAVTVTDAALAERDYTYGELRDASERVAALLEALGVMPGDRVGVLLPKRIEHLIALLAILRVGAVHVPLFTAFAAPTVAQRLEHCEAKVVFTDAANRDKVGDDGPVVVNVERPEHGVDFRRALATGPAETHAAAYAGEDDFILLYTSGTTGYPGGVGVPVRALAAFRAFLEFGLDVRGDDVYWNAADPGWAYGLYYGLVAPLLVGRRTLLLNAPFDPALAWRVLERFGVTNLAAAPTVYRALRVHADDAPAVHVRVASSAGEPLNPDVIGWARSALGAPVHDQYGRPSSAW